MAKSRRRTDGHKTPPCARLWDPVLRLCGPRTESHRRTVDNSASHIRKSHYPTMLDFGIVGHSAEPQKAWQHPPGAVSCAATISNALSKDQTSTLLPQPDPPSSVGQARQKLYRHWPDRP